jgi:hypothetical protein
MGKLAFGSTFLTRATAFWGWFIKKSPAFIVLTSVTVVSVFGLGIGGTLAATGLIPNPFASGPTESETSASDDQAIEGENYNDGDFSRDESPPTPYKFGGTPEGTTAEWVQGSSWNALGPSGTLSYRWATEALHTRFIGPCPADLISVHYSSPNYGYLSENLGIGVGWSRTFSISGEGACQQLYIESYGYYKCFNFNEVWIDIVGQTPLQGFYKIPIPDAVARENCPSGAEKNDPTRFLGIFGSDVYEKLKDYPEAVITPPTRTSPPRIEWGANVSSTPSPTPTTEPSPTPTTEPSPTPTSP